MMQSLSFARTLVVAPHPDDEVLGAGGTIARLAEEGHEVFVAVVTTGRPPAFPEDSIARVRSEAKNAHGLLGVKETFWLNQPAAELTETPNAVLNEAIGSVVRKLSPTALLLPFPGDIHVDHQLVFRAGLVAARPHQSAFPKTVLAYETLSETNWNAPYLAPAFAPNVYLGIEGSLDKKLAAMQLFASQLRAPPHERSLEALSALARVRGATIHEAAAEAFVLVRHVL